MKPNNFAMKDWHLEHVEKVIVRFVKGISPDASSFEKRNYKKYSTVSSCAKQIEYDIKHGSRWRSPQVVADKAEKHSKTCKEPDSLSG